MDKDLIKKRRALKKKNEQHNTFKKPSNYIFKYLIRLLITIILTLICLIVLKTNTKFKTNFYKLVFDTNFSFASVNNAYQKYFGSPIPFKNLVKTPVNTVFNEKLKYKEANMYKDGVKLRVDKNYLIPLIESGMVVFIGDKEGYGNTVIIQQINGVDAWYSNVTNINVKLYDYIEAGSLLGESKDDFLYMVFSKEGKKLNYKDYIK